MTGIRRILLIVFSILFIINLLLYLYAVKVSGSDGINIKKSVVTILGHNDKALKDIKMFLNENNIPCDSIKKTVQIRVQKGYFVAMKAIHTAEAPLQGTIEYVRAELEANGVKNPVKKATIGEEVFIKVGGVYTSKEQAAKDANKITQIVKMTFAVYANYVPKDKELQGFIVNPCSPQNTKLISEQFNGNNTIMLLIEPFTETKTKP